MDKIFEKEVQEYLKTAGVSEKEIKAIKLKQGKNAVLKLLVKIIKLIQDDNYSGVERLLEGSPAGDDTGSDNSYIDFGDCMDDIEDIGNACRRLRGLQESK